nr:reverse transcriptase domain-containing protein [Tanacetum cinerariifolium]
MERSEDGSLYFLDRIWVSLVEGVRIIIMDETHKTRYSVHPGADKMYHDIRDMYWWPGMKKDIAIYVSKCLTCSKVIVDRLTKSAHFLAIREDYSTERLARLYIDEIVARHRVPMSIISDRDGRFTSRFWQMLQKALGTRLDMSTAYHPQTDGQIADALSRKERVKPRRVRAMAMTIQSGVKKVISVAQGEASKVENVTAEMLCGQDQQMERKKDESLYFIDRIWVSSLVLWAEIRGSSLIAPELLQEMTDKVVLIKEKLKACLADANLHVPLDKIKIDKTLHFVEEPVEIMDREVKTLKRSKILIVKVR